MVKHRIIFNNIHNWIRNGINGVYKMNELERVYGKPYINEEMIYAVLKARQESEILQDDTFKVWENEDLTAAERRYWSELGRSIEQFSKEEFAVVTYVAIQNYPEMVFQMLMEEYIINKEGNEQWIKSKK